MKAMTRSLMPRGHKLAAAGLALTMMACPSRDEHTAAQSQTAGSANDAGDLAVRATVNGVPIRELDVQQNRGAGRHGQAGSAPPDDSNILENIILDELMAQAAEKAGLANDATYKAQVERMEAQLRALRRSQLAKLYMMRVVMADTAVSDADLETYFKEHSDEIRSEQHVWQILMKDPQQIAKALADIRAGTPFEEVAARQFPNVKLPQDAPKPWDLGFLRWHQIPEPWQSPLAALKPGDVTEVISGPSSRYWIVKLIERRTNEELNIEKMREPIRRVLAGRESERRRAKVAEDLKAAAKVTYAN